MIQCMLYALVSSLHNKPSLLRWSKNILYVFVNDWYGTVDSEINIFIHEKPVWCLDIQQFSSYLVAINQSINQSINQHGRLHTWLRRYKWWQYVKGIKKSFNTIYFTSFLECYFLGGSYVSSFLESLTVSLPDLNGES